MYFTITGVKLYRGSLYLGSSVLLSNLILNHFHSSGLPVSRKFKNNIFYVSFWYYFKNRMFCMIFKSKQLQGTSLRD